MRASWKIPYINPKYFQIVFLKRKGFLRLDIKIV
jgi:hypothetical protein